MNEGLKSLGVKVNTVGEVDEWYEKCHAAGVASSICRPANPEEGMEAQISLKVCRSTLPVPCPVPSRTLQLAASLCGLPSYRRGHVFAPSICTQSGRSTCRR